MRTPLWIFTILICLNLWCPGSEAATPSAEGNGFAQGYVADVSAERSQKFYEIYIFASPPPHEKSLSDVIFNKTLSQEFRTKYREKFGQIDTESIIYQKTNFNMLEQNGTAATNVVLENDNRKQFAEYMTKRLVEFHVDNYFKNDPVMKPVYEAKQKLSNMEVKVGHEVKLNIRYELSGNTLDLIAKNPWCDAKMSLEMDPAAFGPSSVQESRLWIGKDINTHLRVNTNAALVDGIGTVEFVRKITANLTGLFSISSYFKNGDPTVKQLDSFGAPTVRESRAFVGFSHVF